MLNRDVLFWLTVAIALFSSLHLLEQKSARKVEHEKVTQMPVVNPEPITERPKPVNPPILTNAALPDFSAISNVKAKKQAFFDFVRPMVAKENLRLLSLRQQLLAWQTTELSDSKLQKLHQLAKQYRLKPVSYSQQELLDKLLQRIDTVPVSLALSQSANESAWGTSRFARMGNNLFGQWCFKPGCGIIPNGRATGASHEVAKFSSVEASVKAYIHNLNTNQAYEHFRFLRTEQRQQQQPLSGTYLAEGLLRYSSRGEDYIKELQAMIRINELAQFDLI